MGIYLKIYKNNLSLKLSNQVIKNVRQVIHIQSNSNVSTHYLIHFIILSSLPYNPKISTLKKTQIINNPLTMNELLLNYHRSYEIFTIIFLPRNIKQTFQNYTLVLHNKASFQKTVTQSTVKVILGK